jgi:hypothetical protein
MMQGVDADTEETLLIEFERRLEAVEEERDDLLQVNHSALYFQY